MRGGFLGKPRVESRDDPGDMVACIVHAISSVFKWTVLFRCVVFKKKGCSNQIAEAQPCMH